MVLIYCLILLHGLSTQNDIDLLFDGEMSIFLHTGAFVKKHEPAGITLVPVLTSN
jgi:hypothetical protein